MRIELGDLILVRVRAVYICAREREHTKSLLCSCKIRDGVGDGVMVKTSKPLSK